MKKYVSILLILSILFQPFYRLWIVIAFEINHDFIAKTLCERRNIPDNDCQGYCYLCKRLHQADEREQKIPVLIKLSESILYCHEQCREILPEPFWQWFYTIPLQTLYFSYRFQLIDEFLDPPEQLYFL